MQKKLFLIIIDNEFFTYVFHYMKISQIKISNISTFPFIRHFSDKQWVVFDSKERNNFNILIWPNWSWKSTFLGIINQIFRVWLIKSYHYDRELFYSEDENKDIKKTITTFELKQKKFYKHYLSNWKLSKVAISIKLNQYDFENISFISENYKILNWIIEKYSNLDIRFTPCNIDNLWINNEIYLELELDTKTWNMTILNEENLSWWMRHILYYIQNLELIQLCINIYNDHERDPDQKKLHALKNTFAFLKSERPFLYEDNNSLVIDSIGKRSEDIDFNNKNRFSSVWVWYDLFVIKLLKKIRDQFTSQWNDIEEMTLNQKIELIKWTSLFNDIAEYIYSLLWLHLDVAVSIDEMIHIVFKNHQWIDFTFDKLSSGEKSIVMILFSLFGYDLSNWLFIIDEPELHLHPYMLKHLIEILKKIGKKLNMQFICATHSPLLIDEQSIHSVYKFSLVDGKTNINYPVDWLRDSESSLIHILKFENVSKIFFIDKIIMVEWETDEYFWKFYLNFLSKQWEYEWKFENYEILNINWKWSYKKWTRFLNKFGIKWYFIWDRDNTIENNIVEPEEMSEYIKLTKSHMSSNWINREKFYFRIINTIKKYYPNRYKYIISKIKTFYESGIFILNWGDLETYLWLEKKWLESTINFCNSRFYYRLHDEKMTPYREEFEKIVKMIFDL